MKTQQKNPRAVDAFICEQRQTDAVAWENRVNARIVAQGGVLHADGWGYTGDGVSHFRDSQGRKWYPVGSVRWQWEEQATARESLSLRQ